MEATEDQVRPVLRRQLDLHGHDYDCLWRRIRRQLTAVKKLPTYSQEMVKGQRQCQCQRQRIESIMMMNWLILRLNLVGIARFTLVINLGL